ncbi:musculin-like [Oratosquilla oratoria]|uniref:musculin-like n=1 Tax=Oratosquilla oratoria TaxID=337810 RepID=UPI003F7572E0
MPRKRRDTLEGGCGGGGGGCRVREKPQQRNAANARERARMRILSRAFSRLKTTLPWVPADTKLSKLDTLRLATSYIAHLRALLHEDSSSPTASTTPAHPLALTWPFSFQRDADANIATSEQRENYPPYDVMSHTHNPTHPPIVDRFYDEDLNDLDYYSTELMHMA